VPGPYELYLIRHGVAEERGDAWPDDAKRPLTDDGTSQMRKAARGLARLGVAFDVVLTSPYVRTRQTADIIATAFQERPPVVAIESLAPGGSIQSVLSDLERQTRRSRIALVGHEPNIGELAARLAGARYPIEFKKGAVCRIDVKTFPAGPGRLRWFMTSKILRALRK
jgi:phosphohistidine phosphatase